MYLSRTPLSYRRALSDVAVLVAHQCCFLEVVVLKSTPLVVSVSLCGSTPAIAARSRSVGLHRLCVIVGVIIFTDVIGGAGIVGAVLQVLHGLVHVPLLPRRAVALGTVRRNVVSLTTTVAHFTALGKAGLGTRVGDALGASLFTAALGIFIIPWVDLVVRQYIRSCRDGLGVLVITQRELGNKSLDERAILCLVASSNQ